jgi:hypothetical protein
VIPINCTNQSRFQRLARPFANEKVEAYRLGRWRRWPPGWSITSGRYQSGSADRACYGVRKRPSSLELEELLGSATTGLIATATADARLVGSSDQLTTTGLPAKPTFLNGSFWAVRRRALLSKDGLLPFPWCCDRGDDLAEARAAMARALVRE